MNQQFKKIAFSGLFLSVLSFNTNAHAFGTGTLTVNDITRDVFTCKEIRKISFRPYYSQKKQGTIIKFTFKKNTSGSLDDGECMRANRKFTDKQPNVVIYKLPGAYLRPAVMNSTGGRGMYLTQYTEYAGKSSKNIKILKQFVEHLKTGKNLVFHAQYNAGNPGLKWRVTKFGP